MWEREDMEGSRKSVERWNAVHPVLADCIEEDDGGSMQVCIVEQGDGR